MNESLLMWSILCVSAFLAGAVNAIAGGGTLLTFPALMTALGSVAANATSTVALFPGSLASTWGYRKELAGMRPWLTILVPPSIVGGALGSWLLTAFDDRYFDRLVPWLILLASSLFLIQKPLSRLMKPRPGNPNRAAGPDIPSSPGPVRVVGLIAAQFLIAVYGGYFGAGIGILMLSTLGLMGIPTIHQMNAVKTFLAATINTFATIQFVREDKVAWPYALAMGATAIVGGYLGARVSRKLSVRAVRNVVIAVGFSMSVWYFRRQLLG